MISDVFSVRRRCFAGAIAALFAVAACSGPSSPADAGAPKDNPRASAVARAEGVGAAVQSGAVNGTGADPGAVLILEPRTHRDFPPQAETPVMDQVGETFIPAVLFARAGEPVEFRNSDDTLHNVHVGNEETKEAAFNVAIPTGETYTYTFQNDGFYHVGCDIHPGMSAEILVASTPFTTQADGHGGFSFVDVPPGAYTVRAFSSRGRREQDLEVRSGINAVAVTDSAASR